MRVRCVTSSTRERSRSRSEMQETMTRAFVVFSRAERNVQQRARKWREWRDVAVHRRMYARSRRYVIRGDDVNIGTPVPVDRFKR